MILHSLHIPPLVSLLCKRFSVILFCAAVLWVFLVLVERSDRRIIEKRSKYVLLNNTPPSRSDPFSDDERRVARLFETDTLPRLMRKGLITRYIRRDTGTVMLVSAPVWKARSRFFRENLLTAVSVYNRVNGYAIWTRIVDRKSGKLFAQVLMNDRREIFD